MPESPPGLRVYPGLPSVLPAYARALLGFAKPFQASALPPLAAAVAGVAVDGPAVAAFRQAFGLPAEGPVPPTFAHVLAAPLQLRLLTDPAFPLRVLGTVHVRNPIVQHRALQVGERIDLRVSLSELRAVAQGVEHELRTEVHDAQGRLVWEGISVNLLRSPGGVRVGGARQPAAEAAAPAWEREWRLWLPADTGRHYARLSGDWNPIHLSRLSARLFGFRRAIAHGMWTYARVLAALEPHLPDAAGACRCTVQFRRPLLLPGAACLRANRVADGWDWVVEDPRGQIRHAEGSVRGAA